MKSLVRKILAAGFLGIAAIVSLSNLAMTQETPVFWSVTGPAQEFAFSSHNVAIPVSILTFERGATDIRVFISSLSEQTEKGEMPGGLELCEFRAGKCKDGVLSLAPKSSKRFWLRPSPDHVVGKYTGAVTIASNELPQGTAVTFTVYASSWPLKAYGLGAIVLGILVAFFATTWAQHKISRAQLLLPAANLAARVSALQTQLAFVTKGAESQFYANTERVLKDLADGLLPERLEQNNFVPGTIPSLSKLSAVQLDAYKAYITECGNKISRLEQLINQGFKLVWDIAAGLSGKELLAAQDASTKLDALASVELDINQLLEKIREIRANLQAALPNNESAVAPPGPTPVLSYERLSFEIRTLSLMTWVLFALVTAIFGAYVLIISNLGFGLVTDYLVCFLWGIGFPIGGTLAQQNTTASVRAIFGIPAAT